MKIMRKINFIIAAIIALITFILGYIFSSSIKQNPAECPGLEKPLAKYFESKVIDNISAFASGQVTKISGRNLTLIKEGKEFTISINEDAKISQLIPPKEPSIPPEKNDIKLEEIKVGDKVTVGARLDANASLRGVSVTVLPPWY